MRFLILVLVVLAVMSPVVASAQDDRLQNLLDLVRDHVTAELDRAVAEVVRTIVIPPAAGPLPDPVQLTHVWIRTGPAGGHPGYQRRSLIAMISPPDAMVQCVWTASGGVEFSPGNRSAYVQGTPSGGDEVEVECEGIHPWATGSVSDRLVLR